MYKVEVTFQSSWPQHYEQQIVPEKGRFYTKLVEILNPSTIKTSDKFFRQVHGREQLLKTDAEIVHIRSADGTLVEGFLIHGSSDQAILFAIGTDSYAECAGIQDHIVHQFKNFFQEQFQTVTLLILNPRGISGSEGSYSLEGVCLDYYAAWSYLEDRGLHVLPWGYSLGGRYITEVASWKQREHPNQLIHIVSDRSFDDLTNETKEYMGGITGSILAMIASVAGWGGDIKDAWNSLKGKKVLLYAPEDRIVPYKASLYYRLMEDFGNTQAEVIALEGDERAHMRMYNSNEIEKIVRAVKPLLESTL